MCCSVWTVGVKQIDCINLKHKILQNIMLITNQMVIVDVTAVFFGLIVAYDVDVTAVFF